MQRELEKLEDLLSSGFVFREDYEARKVEIYSRYEQEADLSGSGGMYHARILMLYWKGILSTDLNSIYLKGTITKINSTCSRVQIYIKRYYLTNLDLGKISIESLT
jgi:hypothetical protein